MTQRTKRAGFFSKKRSLSKYESAMEDAYKQRSIYTAADGETSTLATVPDMVVIPTVAASPTLTLPTEYFDEDKLVEVINTDADTTASVGGVTCIALTKTVLHFDGSTWVELYKVDLA